MYSKSARNHLEFLRKSFYIFLSQQTIQQLNIGYSKILKSSKEERKIVNAFHDKILTRCYINNLKILAIHCYRLSVLLYLNENIISYFYDLSIAQRTCCPILFCLLQCFGKEVIYVVNVCREFKKS